MGQLSAIITSSDPQVRNRSVDAFCRSASLDQLLAECAELDAFRRASSNLYERVRALFFLYAIHRFHLPNKPACRTAGSSRLTATTTCCAAGSRKPSTSS